PTNTHPGRAHQRVSSRHVNSQVTPHNSIFERHRVTWPGSDSNRRPHGYEPCELTELLYRAPEMTEPPTRGRLGVRSHGGRRSATLITKCRINDAAGQADRRRRDRPVRSASRASFSASSTCFGRYRLLIGFNPSLHSVSSLMGCRCPRSTQ